MNIAKRAFGAEPRTQKTTSHNLGAVNPAWHAGPIIDPRTGRKILGVPLGHYATYPTGGLWLPNTEQGSEFEFGMGESFLYDGRELKEAGLKKDLNRIIVGLIGMGKSGLVKLIILRGTRILKQRFLYIDPKGEGSPLVDAIPGAKLIEFGRDAKHFLNPMDPMLDAKTVRLPLIKRLILIAMADLSAADFPSVRYHNLLWEAIKEADEHYGPTDNGIRADDPVLDNVLHYLKNPTPQMATNLHQKMDELSAGEYHEARDLMVQGLVRYIGDGDLSGFVHKKTSPGLFTDAPLVVMNCKKLEGAQLTAVVVILQSMTTGIGGGHFDSVITDETWKLSRDRRFVDVQREGMKLGRTEDTEYTAILHNLEDLKRSSYGYDAVTGLISDSSEVWAFRQTPTELANSAEALGFNDRAMRSLIPRLAPLTAAVRIGQIRTIIKPYARIEELPLLETDPQVPEE
jgi:hypothetical protein